MSNGEAAANTISAAHFRVSSECGSAVETASFTPPKVPWLHINVQPGQDPLLPEFAAAPANRSALGLGTGWAEPATAARAVAQPFPLLRAHRFPPLSHPAPHPAAGGTVRSNAAE